MITILGLGPGDAALITREAWEVLSNARTIHLRTRQHPAVAGLPPHLKLLDFDAHYDSGASFDQVYRRIVKALLRAAKTRDVIYAVPGHPLVAEATVPMVLAQAAELGIATRIVSGLSFIEPVLNQLAVAAPDLVSDPIHGFQLCDALEMAEAHHPALNPDAPALVAQVYSRAVAGNVKLTLMNQYPPTHPVVVVNGASNDGLEKKRGTGERGRKVMSRSSSPVLRLALHELDHGEHFDHLTSLYVPAMPRASGLESLQALMAHLRAPEGCPWDQVQTHESLRNTMLEEAFEVLTAIDENDMPSLKEELGDLLFNIVFQVQMATEAEEFRMTDVIGEIHAKLIRRHPHVFGNVNTRDTKKISANWEAIKKQEHKDKGRVRKSVLDGIPPALPALAQAQKMAHKAEKAGFKYDNNEQRMDKVREELDEIMNATDQANLEEEFGDLFFSLADLADGFGIDAESASRAANLKFARRFRLLETLLHERKQQMNKLSSQKLQRAWQDVKQQLAAQANPAPASSRS